MKRPKPKPGTGANAMPAKPPQFMSVAEVARLLVCSEKSVRRYIRDERLQARKIAGIVRVSVDSYLRFVS